MKILLAIMTFFFCESIFSQNDLFVVYNKNDTELKSFKAKDSVSELEVFHFNFSYDNSTKNIVDRNSKHQKFQVCRFIYSNNKNDNPIKTFRLSSISNVMPFSDFLKLINNVEFLDKVKSFQSIYLIYNEKRDLTETVSAKKVKFDKLQGL